MLRCCSLSGASTHTSCYTAVGSFDNDDGDDDDDDDDVDDDDNDDDDGDDVDDDDVDDDDVVVDVVDDDGDDNVDISYETKISFLSLSNFPI